MLYIISSWFVRDYDQEKCNDYEVRSDVISIHDISLMIFTVNFEGATIWDGKSNAHFHGTAVLTLY